MPDKKESPKTEVKGRLTKNTRKKNLVMLALIFGWIALIWVITIIKTTNG